MERLYDDIYKEKHNRALLPPPSTTYYVNAKYRHVVSTTNLIKTNQKTRQLINMSRLSEKDKDLFDLISERKAKDEKCLDQYQDLNFNINYMNKDTFVVIESAKASYLSLRVKQDHCTEDLRLQMYTRNKLWYTFFFTITNKKDKKNVKQHFFAIRRTIKDVEELGKNNHDSIITMDKPVTVFINNNYSSLKEKENLAAYTKSISFKDLIDL